MFNRGNEPKPGAEMVDAPRPVADPNAARSARAQRPVPSDGARSLTRDDGVSVIGRDLTIVGDGLRIVSKGKIQVDGQIRGDVLGQEIVIGGGGRVSGLVSATKVVVHGSVEGAIRGQQVELTARATVDADIYHASLTLEQGASFEGKSRRPKDPNSLVPDLEHAASAPPNEYMNDTGDDSNSPFPPLPNASS
ncbi:MAG: polymer-forming cytoskeletal protein [Pseudomonadota bacterium]